ncbi:MAG: hypothetical protein PHV82_10110 [Victivallaceae bacterium]|nr:hypothetical protein [Victivallaceae bacterium]
MESILSPVNERAIKLDFAEIAEDVFEQGLLNWEDFLREIYPYSVHQKHCEWNINLIAPGQLDEPQIDPNSTICNIRHRFWSSDIKDKQNPPVWCFQVTRNYFIVNLRKNKLENKGDFSELSTCFEKTLEKFKVIFGLNEYKSITLEYWVLLDYLRITDKELAKHDWLEVKEIMNIFKQMLMPRHATKYIPPYQCQQKWEADYNNERYFLSVNTQSINTSGNYPCLRAHFCVKKDEISNLPLTSSLSNMFVFMKNLFEISFTNKVNELLMENLI